MLLLSRLEKTRASIVINNQNRFLIWCYSHKLCFVFSLFHLWIQWLVNVLFLFWFWYVQFLVLFDSNSWCGSIFFSDIHNAPWHWRPFHFWSVTIEPSVCHLTIYIFSLSLSLSFFLFHFMFDIFLLSRITLRSYHACNTIVCILYGVHAMCVFVAHSFTWINDMMA